MQYFFRFMHSVYAFTFVTARLWYTENGFVNQPLYWMGDNYSVFVREIKVLNK